MAEAAPRTATYQDLLDAPPHHTAEILNGSLWVTPRPSVPHQAVSDDLFLDVGGRYRRRGDGDERPGGWIIMTFSEVELVLADLWDTGVDASGPR